MIFKTSPLSIQDNNLKDLAHPARKYPTLNDLMAEQNIASKRTKTVHRRRDLDSLG